MLHVHSNKGDDSVITGLSPQYYELNTGKGAASGTVFHGWQRQQMMAGSFSRNHKTRRGRCSPSRALG
jgi:hypothetical protein